MSLADILSRMGAKPTGQSFGMLFGDSGTGKTYTATKILDKIVEPGKAILHMDSSNSFYRIDHDNMDLTHKVVPLELKQIEDIEEVLNAIAQGIAPFDSIGGIIIDELSQIAQEDLDRVYRSRRENDPAIAETADWGDFRPALARMRNKVMNLVTKIGIHCVIIAHERKLKPEDGGRFVADFSPATLVKVKAPLDYVARLTATNEARPGATEAVYERLAQVHPTGGVDAKNGMGITFVKFPTEFFPDAVVKWVNRPAVSNSPDTVSESVSEPETVSEEAVPTFSATAPDNTNPFQKIED